MSTTRVPCPKCHKPMKPEADQCRACWLAQSRPLEQRFWPKVQKSDGCWLWLAGGDSATGYGRLRMGGRGSKHELTHRISWILTNGPIPDGTIRLTVEHVKDDLRMGVRAPSDTRHLVAMCYGSNVAVPSKTQREQIRDYLAKAA